MSAKVRNDGRFEREPWRAAAEKKTTEKQADNVIKQKKERTRGGRKRF